MVYGYSTLFPCLWYILSEVELSQFRCSSVGNDELNYAQKKARKFFHASTQGSAKNSLAVFLF